MEGFIGASVCRGVRSCWARRRSCKNGYQRLRAPPPPTTTTGRGTCGLGRRTVLGSAACWRFGRRLRRRRRASAPRCSSPLQLLSRILDAYIVSMLSQPLNVLKPGVSSAAAAAAATPVAARSPSPSSKMRRRDASPGSGSGSSPSSRRRDAAGGRGVMLNICVAEVLLLRRTTSEIRRSPLQKQQQPKKDDARRSSVRA